MANSIFLVCLVSWYLYLPKKYNIHEDRTFFFFLMTAEPLSTQHAPAVPRPVSGSLLRGIKITWNSLKMQICGCYPRATKSEPLGKKLGNQCVRSQALQIAGFFFLLFIFGCTGSFLLPMGFL